MKIIQEIRVPKESVNDNSLTVVSIPFPNGHKVNKNEVILELETSKAIITIESEVEGYLEYLCKTGEDVNVNSIVIKIWDTQIIEIPQKEQVQKSGAIVVEVNNNISPIFSNKANKLILENQINKANFVGLDFVNEELVLNLINKNDSKQEKLIPKNANNFDIKLENVEITNISNNKKREIEYLESVQQSGLVSTINNDIDIENIFENTNKGIKYLTDSILPFIIYETSRLLLKYPIFNSFFYDNKINHYNYINVGVAMDIDDGLKVVNLKNSNNMTLLEIDKMVYDLALKYIDKKLTSEELTNTTFTITDLSSFGALSFTPLINKNNSAILGISKIDTKLNRIIISLSFDHRVTEGKIASLFLQELKERIESYKLSNTDLVKNIICNKCYKKLSDDLNDIGFIKIINKDNLESYICDSCLFKF